MSEHTYTYLIIGGGVAGASAVEGIREIDKNDSILLIGEEDALPYNRPPLSKMLWQGTMKVGEIFVQDKAYYDENGVTLLLKTKAAAIDTVRKTVTDGAGRVYGYRKLLIATGGVPRRLKIPGSDLEGICYYRTLNDYLRTRAEAVDGRTAVVIGGGFIGSELAASLVLNKVRVSLIYPDPYLCSRTLPERFGRAVQENYREKGVEIINEDKPAAFAREGGKFVTRTEKGRRCESDILIVGVGTMPSSGLVRSAGLETGNGIVVNEYLQTSNPDVYAAGDNAFFPYQALKEQMRVEHWDNAVNQGLCAGRNMAGARTIYTHMPAFFTQFFDIHGEAVGDIRSNLETVADWQKENDTGTIYYLKNGKLKGMLMCNIRDRIEDAREMIKKNLVPEVV